MTPWLVYGSIAGVFAFAATFAGNLLVLGPSTADLCRAGVVVIPLGMLAALAVFVAMALAAGFASSRADGALAQARRAGLLVGLLSGAALPAIQPFLPAVGRRIAALTAACPDGGAVSFGGSSPPPEVANAINAIGASPPPGAFTPFGPSGDPVASVIGMAVTVAIGVGIAVVAGQVGGMVAAARRSSPPAPGRPGA